MNPVEKVKAILDGLTSPLSRDSPFSSQGRKVSFVGNNQEIGNLSFEAFFARINTFEAEYWGSAPNAAIFLAKYGFKIVSGYKVQCVSCRFEIDFEVFLTVGKAEIVHTLAINCHKQNCRWPRISTPKEYFEIPRNPHRILHDMKVTITDLAGLESDLPLVRKESWCRMGITEDLVVNILDFLDTAIDDKFSASCVVLSLCGWVKRSNTTLQCNFCRKVIGGNNFAENVNNQKPLLPAKHSRVVSLLFNQIKRGMNLMKTSEESRINRIDEKGFYENVPEVVPENRKTGTYSPPTGCSESDKHSPNSSIIFIDDKIQSGLKISKDEYTRMRETGWVLQAQEIKRRALRFLWNDSRRWREQYPFNVLKLNMESKLRELSGTIVQHDELPPVQSEELPRSEQLHEVPQIQEFTIQVPKKVCENLKIITKAINIDGEEWLVPSKICDDSDICRTSGNNVCTLDINDECRFNPEGASRDDNGHCSIGDSNWEGLNSYCESFVHDEEITVKSCDKNVHSVAPEKYIPEYTSLLGETVHSSTNKELSGRMDEESFCVCDSHISCSCEVCATRTNLNGKLDSCNNSISNQSCNNSEVSNSEVCGNSSGRRKRKRVPESEQNGSPNPLDMQVLQEPAHFTRSKRKVFELMRNEPAHFTRSKRREFELMRNELSKSKSHSESKSHSDNAREVRSGHGHTSKETAREKGFQNVRKSGDLATHRDEMNIDTQNAKDAYNGTEGKTFIPGHKPRKCSIHESLFQNVQDDGVSSSHREEIDKYTENSTYRGRMINGNSTQDAETYQIREKEFINGGTSGEYSMHATRFQISSGTGGLSRYRDKMNDVTDSAEKYDTRGKEFIHNRASGEKMCSTRFQTAGRAGDLTLYREVTLPFLRKFHELIEIDERAQRNSKSASDPASLNIFFEIIKKAVYSGNSSQISHFILDAIKDGKCPNFLNVEQGNLTLEEYISSLYSKRDCTQSWNENGQESDILNVEQDNTTEDFTSGIRIVSSVSVQEEGMLQNYVEEEGRNLENGYGSYRQYSGASESHQNNGQCGDYGVYEEVGERGGNSEYDDSEKVPSERTIAISSTESSFKEEEAEDDDEDSEKNTSGNTIVISSSQSSGEGEDEGGKSTKIKQSVEGGGDSENIASESIVVLSHASSRVSRSDVHNSVISASGNAKDISSACSNVEDNGPAMIISESKVISSSESNVGIEDEVNLQNNLRTPNCKRKRNKSEEDCTVSCGLPNLEKHSSEMCRSYVHPELEHRFWCFWRIPFSDDLETPYKKKKGWEYYATCIHKALERHKTEKYSVLEVEKQALNNLTEILNFTRRKKSKDVSS